ncbi:MAG TPA: YjgP/YjgQ family permease [bacterium]|nr:YjgP/YjgQ family permease [bacterium]
MKILDRYLVKNFFATLVFALIAFSAMFIIIDVIGFLDKFIDHNIPLLIVIEYYIFYLPYIIILTLPVATLLASLFSVGQLARYNEITAMRSSGMSSSRILMPLFVAGVIISLTAMYSGERFVPYTNQMKKEVYDNYINKNKPKSKRKTNNIQLQLDADRWLLVSFFDIQTNTAFKVSIETYNNNVLIERTDAPRMSWKNEQWVVASAFTRRFSGWDEEVVYADSLIFKTLIFKPDDIARVQKKAEEMSYWELNKFIQEIRRTGGKADRWLVELYLKIAFPFANLIIILFGASLASRKTKSGTAVSFGVSLFICFLYFGFIKVGQSLGHNGLLHPLLAAWIGNIVFGAGGLYLLLKSN